MRLQQPIQVAALVGLIAELVLTAPLFLWEDQLSRTPLPRWAAVLQIFQMPGAGLVEHLLRASTIRRLAGHLAPYEVVHITQGIVILLQAALFAIVALGVIYASAFWKHPGSAATTPTGT